jgi:tripartite-type tricarboxylate transporter receptor subunit TctC
MRASRRQFVLGSLGAAAATFPALRSAQAADSYPSKVITFICPWPAGGTADVTMRALCTAAGKALNQTIVLENRAGASGMIGLKALANARPDGYTIGQIPISVTRFAQLGLVQLDPLKDLSYIARVSGQSFGIAVRADAPWKTLKDLVADAKARPDMITYSMAGLGGATHVGMEQFAMTAGVKFRAIPYKGGSEALQGLLAKQVDLLADSSSWASLVQSGQLRLLATWGAQRMQEFKDVPTLRDAGWNVVVDAPNGVGGPKNLPPEVMTRLRAAFKVAAASPEFADACSKIDAPILYMDAPEYQKYVADTYAQDTKLIAQLHLKQLLNLG